MLAFKDFVPKQLRAPHFGLTASAIQGEYETLEAALAAASEWVSLGTGRVINVETVVLPNLWSDWERGTHDAVFGSPAGAPLWFQFIRVWYEESP